MGLRLRDIQNGPWPCFYVTISENVKKIQYFDFETDFPKNENHFEKTGLPFFS